MLKKIWIFCWLLPGLRIQAQENGSGKTGSYLDYSWKKVATQMPAEWYATAEAKRVAETVLFCQYENGGWAKNKPYHHPLTAQDSAHIISTKNDFGATIDNGATTMELIFLAHLYRQQEEPRYHKAIIKGLDYLLKAQYSNGGWPQFYPFGKGKTAHYSSHITYNDNAMVNVLRVLKQVATAAPPFDKMGFRPEFKAQVRNVMENGIDCILKTQIRVNGQPTVWCAQHDEVSLLPANARTYELASFSGQESVGIVQFLMETDQPSKEVIRAVQSAMQWLDEHKITGIRIVNLPEADGKKNRVVVEDPNATPLLARFYDLETGKPFFCDRDGIKKSTLAEIGSERRNGYSWYSDSYPDLQQQYENWKKKWSL